MEQSQTTKLFFILGAVSSFLSVTFGAFAAHALKNRLSVDLFNIFEVGVRYQIFHALGLFVVAWAAHTWSQADFSFSGWMFVLGTVFFSGSLYVLSLTGLKWLGMITPIGGFMFLAGWFWLAWTAWKNI